MQLVRPAVAADPRSFGRGTLRVLSTSIEPAASQLSADLKLFGMTFLAGFVFVSVLIG